MSQGQPTETHLLDEGEFRNLLQFLTIKEHHSLSCCNQFRAMPEAYFFSPEQVDAIWKVVGDKFGFTSDALFEALKCTYHRTVGLKIFQGRRRNWEKHIGAVDSVAVLKAQMGWTFRFVGQNPTNHYIIELDDPPQRQVLRRLTEISNDATRKDQEGGHWPREQHENAQCFRNMRFNGQAFEYSPTRQFPTTGKPIPSPHCINVTDLITVTQGF